MKPLDMSEPIELSNRWYGVVASKALEITRRRTGLSRAEICRLLDVPRASMWRIAHAQPMPRGTFRVFLFLLTDLTHEWQREVAR